MTTEKSLKEALRRLSDLSEEHSYDPKRKFDWPASLPEGRLWMSTDLLSVSGTPHMANLTEEQLWKLSRWELVNFFSFNVHGIRELMLHVLSRIHTTGFEEPSEFFHHFLDEENKHMWFFAEFCKRYGGKIYFTQNLQFPTFIEADIECFIAFAKILIAEQVSDFYNTRMMVDESLPAIVRKVNRVHHEDEVRHIAMGLRVVRELFEGISEKYPETVLLDIDNYLRRYMQFFVQSFYNPSAYRDAGLPDPYEWRKKLIDDPARREFHKRALAKTFYFFQRTRLIASEAF